MAQAILKTPATAEPKEDAAFFSVDPGLDALERDPPGRAWDIGTITAACALGVWGVARNTEMNQPVALSVSTLRQDANGGWTQETSLAVAAGQTGMHVVSSPRGELLPSSEWRSASPRRRCQARSLPSRRRLRKQRPTRRPPSRPKALP